MRSPNISTSSPFVTEFDVPPPLHPAFVEREAARSKRVLACVFLAAKSRKAPGFDGRLLDETVPFWGEEAHATTIHYEMNARTNDRLQKWVLTGTWYALYTTHGY